MKWYVFLWALLISSSAGAQTALDSLQQAYRAEKSEQKRIDILNQIAFQYSQISLEKSREVAVDIVERANLIQYNKGVGDGYNNLGIGYAMRGKYDMALDFFIKALKVREQEGDLDGSAKVMSNLSGIFMYQGEYKKALDYAGKSLEILRKQDNKVAIGNTLLAHGLIYEGIKDTLRAGSYYRQALKVFQDLGAKPQQANVLLSLADMQEGNGQHQLALENCFRAMDLIDLKEDYINKLELLLAIGRIYSGLNNFGAAEHYLREALQLADNTQVIQQQLACRLRLSELFEKEHHYDSALHYYQSYSKLNNETFSKERATQMAMLEKVYESEKKDQQLQLNQEKIRSQRSVIVAISGVLLLVSASGFMLYRYYRQKNEANIQLSELNKLISERNEEITAQSEELIEANEEIRRINESLEEEVNFRTDRIKTQNEKLINYAYFNAHKVRGPLARILGLTMLLEMDRSVEESRELNKKILDSAREMDEVVKEINKRLENENPGGIS